MKEASQSTEEIPFFNPIHKIFKAFAAHVNSGATLIIGKEKYALYLRIQGDGLNDLYDIVFPNEGEKINWADNI